VRAVPRETDVVIIGSGFAGIGMGIALKQSGRHNFVILEQTRDLGGTWRDNTYPGCACDVPSYLYSFSFAQNPQWSRMFPPQQEIWDYLRGCVDTYRLGTHLTYDAEVTGARYDEDAARWDVEVAGVGTIRARVLVSGAGALHVPHLPDLPGLPEFEGTAFHSSQWNHEHDLTGRRVAVVGTGASAVQFLPKIAPQVEHLTLFQRTPAWVTPKPNRRISRNERDLYARRPIAQRVVRDLVYWALEARGAGFVWSPKAMGPLERAARRHLERQVEDPGLRATLTPDYQIGCKRVLLSSDFYPALGRDNVSVVPAAVTEVRPRHLVGADGVAHEVDTIIFGTGFEVAGSLTQLSVVGRGGADLAKRWETAGAGAHLGITVAGFPNLFLLLGPNTGLGHSSVVFMIESQIRYVVAALDLLDRREAATMEVRPHVEQAFRAKTQSRLADTVWQAGCTSWYQDEHGRNVAIWPGFTWRYWLATRRVRSRQFLFRSAAGCQEPMQ